MDETPKIVVQRQSCAYQGCCKCPHGCPSLHVLISSIFACAMAVNAAYGCFFVTARNPFGRFPDFDGEIGLGLMTREDIFSDGYSCIMYSADYVDNALDGTYAAARVFGFASSVSFAITTLCLLLMACWSYHRDYFYYIGAFSMAGSLFQVLTFLIFMSNVCDNNNCNYSVGAGLAVAATMLGFLNGILLFNMPPINPPKEAHPTVLPLSSDPITPSEEMLRVESSS